MKQVHIRDHPCRTMANCFEWAQAHATGRWDFAMIRRPEQPIRILNDAGVGVPEAQALKGENYSQKLRDASIARPINYGRWLDEDCKRFGSRNLAVLKQFVRIVIAFERDSDASAFRKWLRGDVEGAA